MSDVKLKLLRPAVVGVEEKARRRLSTPTGSFVRWRLATAKDGESVRWQNIDGRVVTISLGHDAESGKAIVADATGKRVVVDSYEGALELARSWRT